MSGSRRSATQAAPRRPLHRGAEEVERRRRRGGEDDVDALAPYQPDRERRRERAPGRVLVGHQQLAPQQRRLRAEPRDALLVEQLLRRTAGARPDVAHAMDPGLRRQLELIVGDRAGHVRCEHVGLDPERREVRRELERPLNAASAARRKVARHEQNLQRRNGTTRGARGRRRTGCPRSVAVGRRAR